MQALASTNRTSWLGGDQKLILAVEMLTTKQNKVRDSRVEESQSIRENLKLQSGALGLLQAWLHQYPKE